MLTVYSLNVCYYFYILCDFLKNDLDHGRSYHSHIESYLRNYKSDLDHLRSDYNHFKSYLSHYKSDLGH